MSKSFKSDLSFRAKYDQKAHAHWAKTHLIKNEPTRERYAELDGDYVVICKAHQERYERSRNDLQLEAIKLIEADGMKQLVQKWLSGLNMSIDVSRVTIMTDYLGEGGEDDSAVLFVEFAQMSDAGHDHRLALLKSRVPASAIEERYAEITGVTGAFTFYTDEDSPFYDPERALRLRGLVADMVRMENLLTQSSELSSGSLEQISAVRSFLAPINADSAALPVGAKKVA